MLDRHRLEPFLTELGRRLRTPTRLYLVGRASAVVAGWRDADLVRCPAVDAASYRRKVESGLRPRPGCEE